MTPAGHNELADLLSEFARTMLTDFPIQRILDHLVGRIVEVMPITAAGVTLISPELAPRYVAASNDAALRYERLQTDLREGPCVAAFRTGEAISVPDLATENRFPRFSRPALGAGLLAVFTFPLHHGDVQLGALDLYRDRPGALSPRSMITAQTLADVAAAYLINAQVRSDLQEASDQSREAALHDPLTGLPNRVLMLELLDQALRRTRRSGKQSAVFFVDLDRFKEVNDTYGHQAGDALLAAVAQRLTDVLRPSDSLARLAGDEFVALCEDIESPSQADGVANRFLTALSAPFELGDVVVTMHASIGIAFADQDSQSADDLLRDADLAMYENKRASGVRPEPANRSSLRLTSHHGSLTRDLRGALRRGELHVEYQPILTVTDGRLAGIEALLRWTHPTRGVVAPAIFISFAERSGQINELGRWLLEQACNVRNEWLDELADLPVSVNVSAHQLMSADFVDTVASVLERCSTAPASLWLEITESVLVLDNARARVVLGQLERLGVHVVLDDFGTGYSSLSHLTKLPIEAIKIDQSFVANLAGDPEAHKIVAAIIQLAHGLGLTVVSEGVETTAQLHELAAMGSDLWQGFLCSRPTPAVRFAEMLARVATVPAGRPVQTRPEAGR